MLTWFRVSNLAQIQMVGCKCDILQQTGRGESTSPSIYLPSNCLCLPKGHLSWNGRSWSRFLFVCWSKAQSPTWSQYLQTECSCRCHTLGKINYIWELWILHITIWIYHVWVYLLWYEPEPNLSSWCRLWLMDRERCQSRSWWNWQRSALRPIFVLGRGKDKRRWSTWKQSF